MADNDDPVYLPAYVGVDTLQTLALIAATERLEVGELISAVLFNAVQGKNLTWLRSVAKCANGEYFEAARAVYSIAKAREIIGNRAANFTYKINDKARAHNRRASVNNGYMMTTDLSKPIIVIPDAKLAYLPIDGNQRIGKAIALGRSELPAHLLSEREALQVRIDAAGKRLYKAYVRKHGRK